MSIPRDEFGRYVDGLGMRPSFKKGHRDPALPRVRQPNHRRLRRGERIEGTTFTVGGPYRDNRAKVYIRCDCGEVRLIWRSSPVRPCERCDQ